MLFFLCPVRPGLGLCQHLQHLHQFRISENQSQLCRINAGSSHFFKIGLMLGFPALKGFRTFSRVEGSLHQLCVNEPESDTEQSSDEKDQLIAQLREELKKTKAALHSAETESRNARKELTSARSVYEREHRELADLREIVFNAQFADSSPDQQPQSPESPEYDYPYETQKRTTVFGGHDTFLKAIKPMLPNVRFIDAHYMTFSPELVRNADIVWVQINCISNPMFWNVV